MVIQLTNLHYLIQPKELTEAEAKYAEAHDQVMHLILMGLPVDVYAAMYKCKNAHAVTSSEIEADTAPTYYTDAMSEYDNNTNTATPNMHLTRGEVEEDVVTNKETNAYYESLLNNFHVELERCITVNRNTKAKNERLTTELALRGLQVVETASKFSVTPSKCSRDDVRNYIDDVKVADSEKPKEDSTGDKNLPRTLGDYSRRSHEVYRNTIELPDGNNVVPLRFDTIRLLREKNAEESWALIEDLTLYDNKSWNDLRDFAKPVKAISLTQDASDRHLIELENQVQCLMEAHLALKPFIQVNKIASSCGICSGPHDTQYCMEISSKLLLIMHPRVSTKREAIIDGMTGALPSDILKSPKLNVNPTSSISLGDSKHFDTLADLGSSVNLIPLYLFKKLKIGLEEEIEDVLGLADGTKSYLIGIVRNVEAKQYLETKLGMHVVRFGKVTLLFASMLVQNQALEGEDHRADEVVQKEGGDNVERAITTDASLDAAQDSNNIFKTQSTAMPNVDIPQGIDTGGSPMHQETMGVLLLRLDNVPPTPYDSPLTRGHIPKSNEGSLKLEELMAMCTKLSKQVRSSDDDLDESDASKQGRTNNKTKPMFEGRDFDELDDEMEDVGVNAAKQITTTIPSQVSTARPTVSTARPEVSTASVLVDDSVATPVTPPTTTTIFDDDEYITIAQTLVKMKRIGLEWLFDIDSLTSSMNYQPVSAGNRTNGYAGLETSSDARQVGKEKVPDQEYILLPLLHTSSNVPSSSEEAVSSPKNDAGKKANEHPACDERGKFDDLGCLDQQVMSGDDSKNINSTNSINTVSPTINVAGDKDGNFHSTNDNWVFLTPITVNAASSSFSHPAALEDYSQMPNQENTGIFDNAYDDRDEGAEANYNNLETIISVIPIPSTRANKDHPKDQII
ncbi:hypothetical protein Tco_0206773 [Tanacetum coccineum]